MWVSNQDPKTHFIFDGQHAFQLGIHFVDFKEHLRNQFGHAQFLNE